MKLGKYQLQVAKRKKRKRVGRGTGSGHGKTSGRGQDGQRSRSGSSLVFGFEGGQMPLKRRVPKRGFTNIFRKEYAVVNLSRLNKFEAGTVVTPALLKEKKIIKKIKDGVKILGNGKIDVSLTVKAHKFSKSAIKKLEEAGGKVEVI